ncbi:MAG: DnaA/Hda family protein, partial [Pseudomonadota bacterium]
MTVRAESASFDLERQWSAVQNQLRAEYGDAAFKTWLASLSLEGLEGDRVRLGVPTRFLRDWIASHYADRIKVLWRRANPVVDGIALTVTPTPSKVTKASDAMVMPSTATTPRMAHVSIGEPEQKASVAEIGPSADVSAPLDPRCTFENFVVGKPNELAFAAAKRVAELNELPFNPLFIYGGVGLGKTHLMHAIAWEIQRQDPSRKVVYLSAEKFMYQFIRALRFKDTMRFKELFRSVDVLMVDDVQFIGGKDSTQEEFFHTFNTLIDRGSQIVISSDRSPA